MALDPRYTYPGAGISAFKDLAQIKPRPKFDASKFGGATSSATGQNAPSNAATGAQAASNVGGGDADTDGDTAAAPSGDLGISDVTGPAVSNMGTVAGLAGTALGVPGLGLAGTVAQAGMEAVGYENDLDAIGFESDIASAIAHGLSFGLTGKATHDQARDAVASHAQSTEAGKAGSTNAFGGKNVGKDTQQSKDQGRGGAAPADRDSSGTNAQGATSGGYANARGDASSANGDGSDKIICTAMCQTYGFGRFRQTIWVEKGRNMHPAYQTGYHAIFRPIVRFAYRDGVINGIVRFVGEDVARSRTADLWHEKRNKHRKWYRKRRHWRGAMYRMVLEPICYVVGRLVDSKKKGARDDAR